MAALTAARLYNISLLPLIDFITSVFATLRIFLLSHHSRSLLSSETMVALPDVKQVNAELFSSHSSSEPYVVVLVGGTSGIGNMLLVSSPI